MDQLPRSSYLKEQMGATKVLIGVGGKKRVSIHVAVANIIQIRSHARCLLWREIWSRSESSRYICKLRLSKVPMAKASHLHVSSNTGSNVRSTRRIRKLQVRH